MSVGLSSRFNILQQSPYDQSPPTSHEESVEPSTRTWVPSRYNIRARTEDGGLVVWNSFQGAMSVFKPQQRETVEQLLTRTKSGVTGRVVGAVKYLVDRGFLIEKGTDEYRRLRVAFGQQHFRNDLLELILLASEDCNFRCTYCYEDFNRGTMEPWVRDAVKKLVEQRAPTLRHLAISWFGGEPLYGWDAIEDLAPFFLGMADQHGLRLSNTMTTNGYLLTPDIADKLFAWNIRSFQITLDGPAETHDRNRPTRDGRKSFDVIFENLRALQSREDNFLVDLRVNFDRDNRSYVPELLALVDEEFGPDPRFKLRFRAVGQWGGANDENLNVCGADESSQSLLEFKEEARKRGLQLADTVREVQGLGGQVCYAARPYNFIIGADGKLMKCTIDLDKKDRNIVGRIKEDGKLELDRDRFSLWTEPAFENDKKCQKCVVLPVCQGMFCPQIRFDTNQSPCTPLRLGAKKELEVSWADAPGRKRTVPTGPTASSNSQEATA